MLIRIKRTFHSLLATFFCFALFLSCNKNINDEQVAAEKPDLLAKTFSSVSGFVTDENNGPVQGASVKVGTAAPSVLTDAYGYFEVKDVEVNKIAATVTVSKPGYFKGFKTWAAAPGKAAFFRIKLIPKTIAGTISASSGGNVSLSNGLIITLPSNGVVKASGNTAYTGNINVAVSWLDPEASDLTETMPGDLRGIDDAGAMKGLTTFGMAAVELTNDAGELLQIAAGKKATITMPLSSLLSAAAASTIPLWYFDESIGLWKEEGAATKTGNTYVGEVSHFSWWNCDLPNATVPLTFTVVDNNGNPVANAHVEIGPTTPGSWSHIGGYTDATGYVSVFVTANNSYNLGILSTCNSYNGTPDYTQTFSVTTVAVDLGNIIVPPNYSAVVTGTITDCAGGPVTNGYILLQNGYYYSRYPVDNTGAYSFSYVICNGTTAVNLVAEDVTHLQQGTPVSHILVAGANAIGNLQACGVTTDEFMNINIDGIDYNFQGPGDTISCQNYLNYYNIIATPRTGNPPQPYGNFVFESANAGLNSDQALITFVAYPPMITTHPMTTFVPVHLTEFGPIGGFMAGNFTTIYTENGANHNLTWSFRVKRTF